MYDSNYLAHYGVRGQKWGVRRYQNEDGSLTEEGKKRYLGDSTGRFDKIKQVLTQKSNRAVSGVKKFVGRKKEEFKMRHKSAKKMTDQELRDKLNRLNMERQYKQVQDDLNGKNRPKQNFTQRHPIINQVAVATAVGVASNLLRSQLQTKLDEVLAPKRADRAKKSGVLNEELQPFLSKENMARNSMWNKSEAKRVEDAKATAKTINDAVQRNTEKVADAVRRDVEREHQRNLENAVRTATERARKEAAAELWSARKTAERNLDKAVDVAKTRQVLARSLSDVPVSKILVPGESSFDEAMRKFKIPRG